MQRRFFAALTLAVAGLGSLGAASAPAKCCVWKVTSGQQTMYIAGSVHALRQSDYPLPAAYDEAFAASSELVFETDPNASSAKWSSKLERAGRLPDNVTLKDKVDPRTWAYIGQVLGKVKNSTDPISKIEHLRPWALSWLLEAPSGKVSGVTRSNGVESYLQKKARNTGKRLSGLVSLDQHIAVFGDMSDADSELFLLLQFIHLDAASAEYVQSMGAWRRGDTAAIDAVTRGDYREAPALYRRLITDRNRAWMPKLESYLRPGERRTRMVVVGAAHAAGEEGLPALLRAKGYQVEQL